MIKLVLLDIDGVLTNGKVTVDSNGNEFKTIDFKDIDLLKRFQTEGGKILPRRITGNCFIHQKKLAAAIKRARILAFIL